MQVRFDSFNAAAEANNPPLPAGASQDSGSFIDSTNTCNDLYCHGTTLASAGSVTSPSWNTSGDARCGSCHLPDFANQALPMGGNHRAHFTVASVGTNLYGPKYVTRHPDDANGCDTCHPVTKNPAFACGQCHTRSTNVGLLIVSPTHLDGQVDFTNNNQATWTTSPLGTDEVLSATNTDRCNHCHSTANVPNVGVGVRLAKQNWGTGTYKLPCLTCHNGTDAFDSKKECNKCHKK